MVIIRDGKLYHKKTRDEIDERVWKRLEEIGKKVDTLIRQNVAASKARKIEPERVKTLNEKIGKQIDDLCVEWDNLINTYFARGLKGYKRGVGYYLTSVDKIGWTLPTEKAYVDLRNEWSSNNIWKNTIGNYKKNNQ